MARLRRLLFSAVLVVVVCAVDRNNFKTCQQSSFCRRHRAVRPGESPYVLLLPTLTTTEEGVFADLLNERTRVFFTLELYPLKDATLRMKINEKNPIKQRFEEPYGLIGGSQTEQFQVVDRSEEGFTLKFGSSHAVVQAKPLKVDVYSGNTLVVSANARGLLKFEHYRKKPEGEPQGGEAEEGANVAPLEEEEDTNGLWEETFKSHTDSKPHGPSSVGMDISFVNSNHVYGIPEHADSFSLKETTSTEPYRLYNLDVFEYELDNPMALYGSVPVMISHTPKHTASIFWHNAAETWVDIKKLPDRNVVSSITGFFSGGDSDPPQVSTHWSSESGIIDLFVMLGSRPLDVFRQYGALTGNNNLPPLFSLGYHQCRWNYNDEEDVRQVNENFDHHDLPMDVMWLDIEHTDGKRYFTWDAHKFPNPLEMTANLTARGRKLVTIVDPHIKRDSNYFFYKENHDRDLFVHTKDGSEFDGWCWPGSSSYLDLTNPEARNHYSDTYMLDRYKGSTLDTFTWNDMNEPSVFNGPEITMQKDNLHPGLGVEHREIHNVYGLLFHQSTYEGHLRRSEGRLRPFILTRAFYAGSQRSSSVWTGDNTADWGHLRISEPMLLSLSVTGITHVGADVGGFFGNSDAQLLSRWYQAAAFQPFMRAHAHLDTKRREPWLFDAETLRIIRNVLRQRYQYLPLWYTLFYENELTGAPPMRPLWVEFPEDEGSFDIDYEHLIGSALLARPVVTEGANTASVYFPPGVWYDVLDLTTHTGPGSTTVPAPRDKIPVYQRGGSIIPRKDRVRRASSLMREDPYTLVVALDAEGKAQGTLYMDDEHTFEYRQGKFLYLGLSYEKGILKSQRLDPNGSYETNSWLERVIIIGLDKRPFKVTLNSASQGTQVLESSFEGGDSIHASKLTIRKPGISIKENFTISIQ
ncbi:neutral alpha-glucosidase AB-like [Eriocheir sinensis]|uniref:neutral alpha-glucosidase AB-like n=1 Tax=Eriocheir sinensis TaxID=95602 RepID=UPI0021C90615|nr:neutral alpha-glucosidase AB-like [Eriocheir sinensis]